MFLPQWAWLYSDLAMALLNHCVLTPSQAPQSYLMLWSPRSLVAALLSKPCAKTSTSYFASCRQGAGLVYVSCVHPHPSKCVYLINKAFQFNYVMSVCCRVQAANGTVSWDPSLKLVQEEKGGSSYMCTSWIVNSMFCHLCFFQPLPVALSALSCWFSGEEEVLHRLTWYTSIRFSVFISTSDSSASEEFG